MKHAIGHTNNGVAVYVDLIYSCAAQQISRQPYLLGLLKELVSDLNPTEDQIQIEHDMGRPVGHEAVVETCDADTIIYAKKPKEELYTRFIKNGKPASTQYVTLLLRKDAAGDYEVIDTWIGRLTPPRPGSERETDDSKAFWESHAYLLDGESIRTKSVTKVCPY